MKRVYSGLYVVGTDIGRLETLPRGADVIGRRVVSEDGRFLGKVSDVLIDREDGRIVGYLLSDHTPGRKLEELLGGEKKRRQPPYLPADANLRAGRDLIAASEDAVSYDWSDEDLPSHQPGAPIGRWADATASVPLKTDAEPNRWVRTSDEDVHPLARTAGEGLEPLEPGREANPRMR